MHEIDPRRVDRRTQGAFDDVDFVDGLPGLVQHPQPTIAPRGAPLRASGWAVDPVTLRRPQAMCVYLDMALPCDVSTGRSRLDLRSTGVQDEHVGFAVAVDTTLLGLGGHELRSFVKSIDGSWYEAGHFGFWLYQHRRAAASEENGRDFQLHLEPGFDPQVGPLHDAPVHANRWAVYRGWSDAAGSPNLAQTILVEDERGRTWCGPANLIDPENTEGRRRFEVWIPAAVLGPGRHDLRFSALDAAGRAYRTTLRERFDVIGPTGPFPLAARCDGASVDHALQLSGEDGSLVFPLPRAGVIGLEPGTYVLEGRVNDAGGEIAPDAFGELTFTGVALPPRRLPAIHGARFRCTFSMAPHESGTYELAVLVVHRGRRSYSRAPLALLKVGV